MDLYALMSSSSHDAPSHNFEQQQLPESKENLDIPSYRPSRSYSSYPPTAVPAEHHSYSGRQRRSLSLSSSIRSLSPCSASDTNSRSPAILSRSLGPSTPDLRAYGTPNKNGTWSCAYPGCESRAVFTRGCDLRKHHKRHTKSYFCRHEGCPQSAGAGFSSKKDLARHEAKHNPGVLCEWDGCGRTFSRVDNMRDHIKRTHLRKRQVLLDPERHNGKEHVEGHAGLRGTEHDAERLNSVPYHANDVPDLVHGRYTHQAWQELTFWPHLKNETYKSPELTMEPLKLTLATDKTDLLSDLASQTDSYGFPSTHSGHSSISTAKSHQSYNSKASVLTSSSTPLDSLKVWTPHEQSYLCNICDKRFTFRNNLKTHMHRHTGEKPFACDFKGCGRHFSVVSNLRRHQKVHDLDDLKAWGCEEDNLQDTTTARKPAISLADAPPSIEPAKVSESSPPQQMRQIALGGDVDVSKDPSEIASQAPKEDIKPAVQSPHLSTYSTSASTSTESSDGESDDISLRKKQIIGRVMQEFYRLFNATVGRSHAMGSTRTSASDNSRTGSQAGGNGLTERQRGKRKVNDDSADPDGDGHSDQDTPKRKKPNANGNLNEPESRLACPYYKHGPKAYRGVYPCFGPGWASVHRLKEHLYRRHALPPQCTRCCEVFQTDADLKIHLRQREGCELQDAQPVEGFDQNQEKKLRCRKKSVLGDAKEDQWREIYLVLFPDTLLHEIPNPYYEYIEDSQQTTSLSPTSTDFARYEAHLNRELPRLVRQQLEDVMEQEIGPIEERLKMQLEAIVRNCQQQVFKAYQDSSQAANALECHDAALQPYNNLAEASGSTAGATTSNFPDLAPFAIPPESSTEGWDSFMGAMSTQGELSDSGYGSLGAELDLSNIHFDWDKWRG